MFENRTIERLDKMLDSAMNGTFVESDYDETKLSRLESKWKEFLGSSVLSNKNLEAERHRLEQFISDISHQTKTPMTNIKMYTELLCEEIKQLQESHDTSEEQQKAAFERISKYAEEITRQDQRLEFLIASLTKLSRLESGPGRMHHLPKKAYPTYAASLRCSTKTLPASHFHRRCIPDRRPY